jgi:RimJ/RimL family protein N-acetyltransferase
VIPVLETERLRLRAPTLADFEPVAAFFASERSRFVGGPRDRFQSWRSFAANTGHWALKGFGMWAVEERATGRYLGQIGLHAPEGWVVPREVGWILVEPAAEGRGYAREAALAARDHAWRALGWTEAWSVIAPENGRSLGLARRLGCRLERRDALPDGDAVEIWRHPDPQAPR